VARQEAACGARTARNTWCVVAGHWPVFSFGGNGPTDVLIDELLPILNDAGVHAYLSGHDHNMQVGPFRGAP
jgi:hypothetical protein